MYRFNTIEDIFDCMLDIVDVDYPVSVVANEVITKELLKEFMAYGCVDLKFCDINSIGYDKEYILTLNDDEDDGLSISVDKAYYAEKNIYLSTDGFVLFHESVPCKAQMDMEKNELTEFESDWFMLTCDEDDEDECCCDCCCGCKDKEVDEKSVTNTVKETFKVNGKCVDKETFEKELTRFEDKYLDNIRDMLLNYCEHIDEMNEWRKMFRW